jgi:two-component system, cell cycle sensor histidine kinase DivJ
LAAARHRAFMAPRLLGGAAMLASLPLYLIGHAAPSAVELVVLGWLLVPVLLAYFLSRTGRYEGAHVLSSVALTCGVTAVASLTGGIGSFAAAWLVVVPLEAALSASRRVVAAAAVVALAAAGILVLLGAAQLLPSQPGGAGAASLAGLGVVSAVLYATGLALGAQSVWRTGSWLLYAEEDRYRLLASNMADVITRHGRDGAALYVSPAAEALFGVPGGVLLGYGLFERVHVADRPAYLTALGDAAALAESRSVELRIRCEDADAAGPATVRFAWIEMHCRPLELGVGKGNGNGEVVAVLRDVSRQKQHAQALEQARMEAERANARKSRFLATMSHELRTPLNAIIGFSEMLMKESVLMLDQKRRSEYAALINESGHHLLSVVNGILDMSKIETDNFEITAEPFAPAQAVAGCCEIVALRAREAGVRIEMALSDDLPEMIADKRAINQILLNLLSNAIRFSDRGGKVVIAARSEAAAIIFTVEDNGVGISEGDLQRLGEPYFQARASYERRHGGTGLGLSIVKGLVRLHGGELSIRSRLGAGTRVTVRLPLDCEQARAAGTSAAVHSAEAVNVIATRSAAADAGAGAPPAGSSRLDDTLLERSKLAVKKSA